MLWGAAVHFELANGSSACVCVYMSVCVFVCMSICVCVRYIMCHKELQKSDNLYFLVPFTCVQLLSVYCVVNMFTQHTA